MKITYYGHSSFLIETEGLKILTDPYDPSVGYSAKFPEVDVVTISHEHFDHNAIKLVPHYNYVLKGNISKEIANVKFESIEAYHDARQGKERGTVNMFKITAESISVVHLADLGCTNLTQEQTEFLKDANIFLIPVGGYFTIAAREATLLIEKFKPNIAIPMHYKLKNTSLNITPLEDFTNGKNYKSIKTLVVTKDTLPEHEIIVLEPQIY